MATWTSHTDVQRCQSRKSPRRGRGSEARGLRAGALPPAAGAAWSGGWICSGCTATCRHSVVYSAFDLQAATSSLSFLSSQGPSSTCAHPWCLCVPKSPFMRTPVLWGYSQLRLPDHPPPPKGSITTHSHSLKCGLGRQHVSLGRTHSSP